MKFVSNGSGPVDDKLVSEGYHVYGVVPRNRLPHHLKQVTLRLSKREYQKIYVSSLDHVLEGTEFQDAKVEEISTFSNVHQRNYHVIYAKSKVVKDESKLFSKCYFRCEDGRQVVLG